MLIARPRLNLKNAREYFSEHFSVGDCYSSGPRVPGEWFGLAAEKLGLSGEVKAADFLRLCEGLHPATGEKLTARMNSTRRGEDGRKVANRRIFYDFTLSPPKSVSVVGLCLDDRILEVHHRAIRSAMAELERFAEARIRKGGQRGQRPTGNIVGAAFRHDSSRELDPHLHTHCVVFNATYDSTEERWKALEVQGIYRAQKFIENYYYHELAKGLGTLGYGIENGARGFRIKGVPASVEARFSKRHQEIDQETQRRIERNGWKGDVNDLRRQVARDVSKRKVTDATASRLRPLWEEQLNVGEAAALQDLRAFPSGPATTADLAGIVAWADEYLFERRSVVNDYELMAAALGRGRGEDFSLAELRAAIDRRGYLREEGSSKLTSREVLRDELEIVVAAHDGRNRHGALHPGYEPVAALSFEQKAVVRAILGSRDFITLFRGGAGTGKSFALQEVERGLVAGHRPVVVLAPQRQQVHDLQARGLPAETLARFLLTGELSPGGVVIVDEAGQIGGRQLRDLVRKVRANGGRLILSGDTRQHGAVAASDALRAIEKHAGLKPTVLRQVRRQDPLLGATARERRFIRSYRAAVKAAARGNVMESFDRLDRLGCIREIRTGERRSLLAAEFIAASGEKRKVLVVAQTRDEVREVNEAIRERLRAAGRVDAGTVLRTFQPLDLGEAQKRDARFYQPGQHACMLRRCGLFAKGEICEIDGANEHGVVLLKDGRRAILGYDNANRLAVAVASEMSIARGDRLQLKFNGRSVEDRPLNNGELVTVRRVLRNGSIKVVGDDGVRKTLTPAQRLFVRGFAITSYGSQGKTVDTVLLADAANPAATSANQWYVSITRGRRRVVVFTSDKDALRASIQQLGNRELALDLRTAITPRVRRSDWRRRALAAIERTRLHESVVGPRPRQARRIAV